jgi:hypothetical protein
MIYKADKEFSRYLLSLPETGFGYQILAANRVNSPVRSEFLVFNTQLIVDLDYRHSEFRNEIANEGLKKVGNRLAEITLQNVMLLPKKNFIKPGKEIASMAFGRLPVTENATAITPDSADGKEVFLRPTAFEDDVRVDFMKNRLLPGTYTTTQADYLLCKAKGDNLFDRYGFATLEPIKWLYLIQPTGSETIRRGVVGPVFVRNGGGVEVFFENGTANRTTLKKMEG